MSGGADNTKDTPQPPMVDNSMTGMDVGKPKSNKPEGMSRNKIMPDDKRPEHGHRLPGGHR